jgi:hypothetical protein
VSSRQKAAGTPASGVVASLLRRSARLSLRSLPHNLPTRFGNALCAVTSATVLAYVRRSVTVGGLAAGAKAVVDLVPKSPKAEIRQPHPDHQNMALWIARFAKTKRLEATCLPRSLAMWAVLEADGYPAVFCMGASNNSVTEPSHAWVECQGNPVLEGEDPRARFARFALSGFYPDRLVVGS